MPHHTELITMLVAGFVLAFVLGAVAARLKLSPLVGYLLAGIIAGPYTPGFVGDQELAPQLAELGVILLMFGVGLHFSWRDLMSVRAIALPGAMAQIAAATLLGWLLSRWMGWSHVAGLVFGLSLSCASTVVLLRALEERQLLETERGTIAVGWLIVEDLACVLALVLMSVLADVVGGTHGRYGNVGTALVGTLLKVGGFVALMMLVGRKAIPWLLARVAALGSHELFTLGVLAIALGVAFGSAELFGVSFALGAFFAGMLLNESEFSHQAAEETMPLRDAFAVLFFVSVGMLFNPAVLVNRPLEVLATFLIIVLGKSTAAYAIVRLFGKPKGTALTISASLAQIGEFSFILIGLALSLRIVPAEAQDLILAGALLSIMTNPLVFGLLDRWLKRMPARDNIVVSTGSVIPGDLRDHALIVGFGRVGNELATLLHERGVPLVVIDVEADRVARAREAGLLAVRGNATDENVLRHVHAPAARLAVIAIPQTLQSGEVIAHLKTMVPDITVLARAHSRDAVKHLMQRGADAAVLAERELAFSLADMVMAIPPFRPVRTPEPRIAAPLQPPMA